MLRLATRASAATTGRAALFIRGGATRSYVGFDADAVASRTARLLAAKEESGLSFDQLADKVGLTNAHTVQLLLGQAKLKPDTAPKLKEALPAISDLDVEAMQKFFPM